MNDRNGTHMIFGLDVEIDFQLRNEPHIPELLLNDHLVSYMRPEGSLGFIL